jgi:hypothetical protein
MLNSAGRNTPVPPHAGQSDPISPAPAPSQANPSAAAPPAGIVSPSAGSAPPRAATVPAAPASYSAPGATVAPAPARSEAAATAVTAPAPQSPEPITTTAAPLNSAAFEPAIAATRAVSAFEAGWAEDLEAIDAREKQDVALNSTANETFSSSEKSQPEADQPLPPQQVSGPANSEIAFCVSHASAAAGGDCKSAREPRPAAPGSPAFNPVPVEYVAATPSTSVPASAAPAISAFAAASAKRLDAPVANAHHGADCGLSETFSSPKILRAQNLQLTRNPPLTVTIEQSSAPKCRVACLTSSALPRVRRSALRPQFLRRAVVPRHRAARVPTPCAPRGHGPGERGQRSAIPIAPRSLPRSHCRSSAADDIVVIWRVS